MNQNNNKIPWLNEGLAGFFEYDTQLYGLPLFARDKEELQRIVSECLFFTNYDRVRQFIEQITLKEYYQEYTDEKREAISFDELLTNRLIDEDYCNQIKQELVNNGTLYPDDITLDELGYNYHTHTEDEISELKTFTDTFKSTTQEQLVDIYYHREAENVPYELHRESARNAQLSVENYENNLVVSELLIQNYEKELEMEEQLLANSEMIVQLYENINNTTN